MTYIIALVILLALYATWVVWGAGRSITKALDSMGRFPEGL